VILEILDLMTICAYRGDNGISRWRLLDYLWWPLRWTLPKLSVTAAVKTGADVYPRYAAHPSKAVREEAEKLAVFCETSVIPRPR